MLLVGLVWQRSWAQSPLDGLTANPPAPATTTQIEPIDPSKPAGPTVYVIDQTGTLATIDLSRKIVRIIGNTQTLLTDIAFAPDGTLYGVSFTQFFRVDRKTAQATFIGNLGANGINALVIDSNGTVFAAGTLSSTLYAVDVSTGVATAVGAAAGGYTSEGDLVFYNDQLLLAGTKSGSTTAPASLVVINRKTGAQHKAVAVGIGNLYGLASTGKNELYGFADTSVYKLNPKGGSLKARAKQLFDVSGTGLGMIYGAAYNGNFQP
jgi:hypothetical protein